MIQMMFTLVLLLTTPAYAQDKEIQRMLDQAGSGFAQSMIELGSKLKWCESFKQKVKSPFLDEKLERKIVGWQDGLCHYVEEMPKGGKMECKYSSEDAKVVGNSYIQGGKALVAKSGASKLSQDSPLEQALRNGTCVISGS